MPPFCMKIKILFYFTAQCLSATNYSDIAVTAGNETSSQCPAK